MGSSIFVLPRNNRCSDAIRLSDGHVKMTVRVEGCDSVDIESFPSIIWFSQYSTPDMTSIQRASKSLNRHSSVRSGRDRLSHAQCFEPCKFLYVVLYQIGEFVETSSSFRCCDMVNFEAIAVLGNLVTLPSTSDQAGNAS